MRLFDRLLLSAYYYASYPSRALTHMRLRSAGRWPVIILFYHRIADDRANPWTASNRTFERQIHWMRKRFDMISLSEAQRRIRSGVNHRPSVAITFDDGYADNCDAALPLLVHEQIPCTYFVTTSNILEGTPFVHDVALGRPLRPNTPQQIRELARCGIEIGAHTRTHADLGAITDPQRLYDEIVQAKIELEQLVDMPIPYFAFPYGQHANLSAAAFELARRAGYEGVCSAYGGFNFPGDDAFHLQRIHADDDMIRLKNWTSLDPRKLALVRRFEYGPLTVPDSELVLAAQGACT
ncbi:MAG TPA: polysaccharide deacetylase family protein [Pirellulales bacterium]|nr:polysaccharide deacetylase family protein [Pirellulales bacterium]